MQNRQRNQVLIKLSEAWLLNLRCHSGDATAFNFVAQPQPRHAASSRAEPHPTRSTLGLQGEGPQGLVYFRNNCILLLVGHFLIYIYGYIPCKVMALQSISVASIVIGFISFSFTLAIWLHAFWDAFITVGEC